MPPVQPGVILDIPSGTEFASLVRDVARRAAQLAGFDERASEGIALAVDECAGHAIERAYKGAPDGRLEVRLEYRGLDLRIEVLDSGEAADPKTVPGVDPVAAIMDSVTYERTARGNLCRLVKRKAAEPSDP